VSLAVSGSSSDPSSWSSPDASLDALLEAARARLRAVPAVRVGRLVEPRRLAALRSPRIVPEGEAWPLGVILLGRDRLWATGEVVVARPADRRGYPAESARRRGELAAAAERGGFAPGEAVHLPARRLDPAAIESGADADPIGLDAGRAVVRWTRGAPPMPLAAYLDERIGLLLHPPERA